MKRYFGGNPVPKGIYMNLRNGQLIQFYGDIRILPGGDNDKFLKLPGWLAVILSPIMGLAFIIFLPLAGIIGFFSFIVYKTGLASTSVGRKLSDRVSKISEAN